MTQNAPLPVRSQCDALVRAIVKRDAAAVRAELQRFMEDVLVGGRLFAAGLRYVHRFFSANDKGTAILAEARS
uniref:hypothetical protein n=1 Tax=Pararhizobium sp. IMCC3301 TaxID=3067904 RepID=UPI002741680F|nr:hypothetical protein [Pararhizobium sp. IMCC3301]